MKASGTALSFPDAKIMVYAAPKAACTSIKRTLAASYAGVGGIISKESLKRVRESLHDLKRNERHSDYLKIAFCRDPFEKIRSIYAEKLIQRKSVSPLRAELGFYKNMPFDEYIALVANTPDEMAEKHLKSQHLFLFRDGPPDMLIRFENLSHAWGMIQKTFKARGGKTILDLKRFNVSKVAKPELTGHLRALIAERYRQDIEMLGY